MKECYCTEDQQQRVISPSTVFGGFWIRTAAYMIDYLLVSIPILIVSFIKSFSGKFDEAQIESFSNISSYIVGVFWWIYLAVLHSSEWQATIGKRAVGLKVVDISGNRISFGRALGRSFSMYLSVLTFFIGFMMIGWTKHKQGLHDIIARTYVVRAR